MKGIKNLWNSKKNGRKKILSLCYSVCLFLLSLLFASLASCQNASAIQPSYYNARFSVYTGSATWTNHIAQNYRFSFDYLYNYEWVVDSINITGNTANIHFETNVVLHGTYFGLHARFHNTDFLTVNYCGSTGQNVTLKSISVSSAQTNWTDSDNYQNRTLTVYADVVAQGFTSGTSDLYCNVGLSNNWAFAASSSSDYGTAIAYFEQQPTRIQFTNDNSEAYQKQTIDAINNLSQTTQQGSQDIVDAINNQSENEKSEYQDQASQNESDISSDTAAQEQQATTLLNAITTVLDTIKDTNASDCNVRLYFFGRSNGFNTVNLCPAGYTSFINTSVNPIGSVGPTLTIRTVFTTIIMIVFLVFIVINILHALKKIYNMFLGGN